jgi:hypothetical protein
MLAILRNLFDQMWHKKDSIFLNVPMLFVTSSSRTKSVQYKVGAVHVLLKVDVFSSQRRVSSLQKSVCSTEITYDSIRLSIVSPNYYRELENRSKEDDMKEAIYECQRRGDDEFQQLIRDHQVRSCTNMTMCRMST